MYLSSSSEARTFVNGRLLNGRVELKSGSRIIFGAAHVFRFVHPSRIEAGQQRSFDDGDTGDDGLAVPIEPTGRKDLSLCSRVSTTSYHQHYRAQH